VASALDLLVHVDRVTGGRRKVVSISEITGMEGEMICMQDIFVFRQSGVDKQGHAAGHFECCGVRPMLIQRLIAEGISLPPEMFQRRRLASPSPESEASR
jgi:pilus assembly protein CpaF